MTLGNFTASSGTWTGGVNALAGTLKMNAALKVNASATLTAGVIDISGQSAELRRNIRTAYPAGVFAADSKSVIRVTSDFAGTDNTIAFLLGKDTLGTLILNRSANFQVVGGLPITPHLKINSPLKIKSLLYLEDGELYHQSGLEMLPGSNIIRTTDAAFSASTIVAPGGKSRRVIYKTGVTSGGLLAGVESLGNLGTMISDLAVELDIKDSLRISDSLAVRSGSLTISSDPLNPGFVDLSGLLTVGPGVSVHTGEGRLLLRNDSVASMGRIGPLESGAQINGSITAQQFMPGKGRAYRYISAPVGGMRFRDLNDDFDYYPNYVWRYQESLTGDKNNGWDRSLTPDSALVAGRGYVLWPRSGYEYVNNTWDVTGPVVQGSFEFHLNFTSSDPLSSSDDGWNLLGNPYPSPVFWSRDLLQWSDGRGGAPVNIDPVVYIRDPAGVFRSWDAETGIGDISEGTGIIPAGTAFWVHATGPSPRLVIHERAKASSGGTFYRKADEIISGLKVSVSTEEQTASCFLLKRYGTNPDYERGLDVLQRPDSVLNISLVSRDGFPLVHYASEELPREIDLVFSKPGIDAVLQIFEIPGKLPVVIWLKDRTTGLLTELKPASSISIVSENDRYVLLTGEQSDGADEEEISFMITPNPVQGNTIRISGPSIAIKRIRIVDLTGRTVKDFANIMATENHIELATDLTAGLYHAVIYKERKTVRVRFVITNR
ncbi:MAG: T9SS type A sorting domain-containing protein [Cyclobacteriaceae bacterium]